MKKQASTPVPKSIDDTLEEARRKHDEFMSKLDEATKDPHSDERIQELLNAEEIVDCFQTKVYKGRHAVVRIKQNNSVRITYNPYHTISQYGTLKPIEIDVTPETFSFLFEVMQEARRRFGIDTAEYIRFLTEGEKIKYVDRISDGLFGR